MGEIRLLCRSRRCRPHGSPEALFRYYTDLSEQRLFSHFTPSILKMADDAQTDVESTFREAEQRRPDMHAQERAGECYRLSV